MHLTQALGVKSTQFQNLQVILCSSHRSRDLAKSKTVEVVHSLPSFWEYCETSQPLPFDIDSFHDYDLAVGISAQQVVYAGVRRSCFMDHTRLSPASPALAI